MATLKDTMIQDVAPLNARIYFDGYLYVGALRMIARPDYFAPYFRKPKRDDKSPFPPEVAADGISWFSHVFTVRELVTATLKQDPHSAADQQLRSHEHWQKWNHGLDLIRNRTVSENWPGNRPHRLYLLLDPQRLGHTISKCGKLPPIPYGYGTAFDRLGTSRCINELTL